MGESWRNYIRLNFCFIGMKSFVDYSVVFVADSPRWGARRRRFDFDRPAVAVAGATTATPMRPRRTPTSRSRGGYGTDPERHPAPRRADGRIRRNRLPTMMAIIATPTTNMWRLGISTN